MARAMPTPMQTVTTSADYRVAAGEQLVFIDQPNVFRAGRRLAP